MHKLCDVFKHYEGQPVVIYTDDGRKHCGIDLNAFEDAVRILDKCNRLEVISYSHIDSVVEPQMRLRCCCKDKCKCEDSGCNDNGFDGDFDEFGGRRK